MRALLQRVTRASVTVGGVCTGSIDKGFLVLLGVKTGDTQADLKALADKIAGLRIFEDSQGKMNLSLGDVGGSILLVSQFTLFADTKRGRRPGFSLAMEPVGAKEMVALFASVLRSHGIAIEEGVFGADMKVELCNDGPVTIMLDTEEWKRLP